MDRISVDIFFKTYQQFYKCYGQYFLIMLQVAWFSHRTVTKNVLFAAVS